MMADGDLGGFSSCRSRLLILDDVKQAGASHTESILHPRAFPFVLFVLVWA